MSAKSSMSCERDLSRASILGEVRQILAEFSDISAERIREEHTLLGDLGMDSLDVVESTMEIEEHFDISVPDEVGERVKTVGDVADGVLAILARIRHGS
jgi:acyl carrier protein